MTKKPMQILHVLDQLSVSSGVSNVVMGYVRNIDPAKFVIDVAVYIPSDEKLVKEIEAKNGNVYQLPGISFPFATEYCKAFSKLLKSTDYPIIHGHLPTAAFLFLKEAKKKKVPYRIIHAHSCGVDGFVKRMRNKGLVTLIPLYANHYISCSNAAADYVCSNSARSKAQLLFNSIDPNRFRYNLEKRSETRKALGIKDKDLCIGHVGRISSIKNHAFLLYAFNDLLSSRPDAKLILVGEGELREALEQQIKEMKLEQSVHLIGESSTVENYYQAFDQFWLPSLKEGWGVAGLEAQCAGLPCLFSEGVPGEIKVVKNNIQFLPIDSPSKWVKTSLELGQVERQDTTKAIYDHGLDISTQIKKLESIYEAMLGS